MRPTSGKLGRAIVAAALVAGCCAARANAALTVDGARTSGAATPDVGLVAPPAPIVKGPAARPAPSRRGTLARLLAVLQSAREPDSFERRALSPASSTDASTPLAATPRASRGPPGA